MNKPRKLTSLQILQALFAISIALAIVNAQGESRVRKSSEGEIAVELFGLVAEQSGCVRNVAAWIDRATRQVHYQCTNEHPDFDRIESMIGSTLRITIEVPRAKAMYRLRFGLNSLPGSIAVLAHVLANFRANSGTAGPRAPLLIYRK